MLLLNAQLATVNGEPFERERTRIVLPGIGGAGGGATEFAQFRRKAESFLRDHLGEAAVAKVRSGDPLSPADVAELQRILVAAGIGDDETFAEASERAGNFGRFARGLVGMDRAATKAAFNAFLDDRRYTRKQIEFVEIVINELADQGVVEAWRFYESPYSGLAPTGPEDLFAPADLDDLFAQLEALSTVMGADGELWPALRVRVSGPALHLNTCLMSFHPSTVRRSSRWHLGSISKPNRG